MNFYAVFVTVHCCIGDFYLTGLSLLYCVVFCRDIRARRSAESAGKEFCGNDANHEWMQRIKRDAIYEV